MTTTPHPPDSKFPRHLHRARQESLKRLRPSLLLLAIIAPTTLTLRQTLALPTPAVIFLLAIPTLATLGEAINALHLTRKLRDAESPPRSQPRRGDKK